MESLAKNLDDYDKCKVCGAKLAREFKGWHKKNYINGMFPEEKFFECGFRVVWNRLLGARILTECPKKGE